MAIIASVSWFVGDLKHSWREKFQNLHPQHIVWSLKPFRQEHEATAWTLLRMIIWWLDWNVWGLPHISKPLIKAAYEQNDCYLRPKHVCLSQYLDLICCSKSFIHHASLYCPCVATISCCNSSHQSSTTKTLTISPIGPAPVPHASASPSPSPSRRSWKLFAHVECATRLEFGLREHRRNSGWNRYTTRQATNI